MCASDPLIHIYLAAVKCTVILQSIIQLIHSCAHECQSVLANDDLSVQPFTVCTLQ